MNASDDFSRIKAVQLASELLCKLEIAFFPIDYRSVFSAFRHQLELVPYSGLKSANPKGTMPIKVSPRLLSKDGFCSRVGKALINYGTGTLEGNIWKVFYDDNNNQSRVFFTLFHELGHVLLEHHRLLGTDTIMGMDNDPQYKMVDDQADQFSINVIAPAPSILRLLKYHGFSPTGKMGTSWRLTNRNAPYLRNLGREPDPIDLLTKAYGISKAAATRRLSELTYELAIWEELDSELYSRVERITLRSGWHCWVCQTRRRTTSLYCPGCGNGWHYEYVDVGRLPRPVIKLRKTGQFCFCSVCGNSALPTDATFCPVCGNPVINECENAYHTDGDFVRSGMEVIRGTHRCRPTDIYCPTCGVLTAFGVLHGPRKNMWVHGKNGQRCRTMSTVYPDQLQTENGCIIKCPFCGGNNFTEDRHLCEDCGQRLDNDCVNNSTHICNVNDRYCRICGEPTRFFKAGFLSAHTTTESYNALRLAERKASKHAVNKILIMPDGTMKVLNRGER